ncbi:MAG: hypothetical protein WCA35_00470 [Kovacikia sp.]
MEDDDRHVAIERLGDRGVMRKGDRFFVDAAIACSNQTVQPLTITSFPETAIALAAWRDGCFSSGEAPITIL